MKRLLKDWTKSHVKKKAFVFNVADVMKFLTEAEVRGDRVSVLTVIITTQKQKRDDVKLHIYYYRRALNCPMRLKTIRSSRPTSNPRVGLSTFAIFWILQRILFESLSAALSAMKSTPRSSRRRCGRDSCREDVAIGSPCPAIQPLGDKVSGTGSPTVSTQKVVDPAGVNGLVASQSDFPRHTYLPNRRRRGLQYGQVRHRSRQMVFGSYYKVCTMTTFGCITQWQTSLFQKQAIVIRNTGVIKCK